MDTLGHGNLDYSASFALLCALRGKNFVFKVFFYNLCSAGSLNGLNFRRTFHSGLVLNQCREGMKGSAETGYFHICTDGKAVPWLFQDTKDFIAGINRIGICHVMTKVIVVAYILMDNHVHFVVHGNMLQCKEFINLYKRLTGKWISIRYGYKDYLHCLPVEIIRIENEESLLNTIAYIDRNAMVAGYRNMPGEYPWGSSRYVFKEPDLHVEGYRTVGSLTRREQRAILNTHAILPSGWKINDEGMILPTSFVSVRRLESIFKTAARYSYFLARKLEGEVEQSMEQTRKAFIPNKELRAILHEMVQKKFGQDDIRSLDMNARLNLARTLRYSYGSTVKQIARMLHLTPDSLKGFI